MGAVPQRHEGDYQGSQERAASEPVREAINGEEGQEVTPNKPQWAVIWIAAIILFTRADYRFFPALGGYSAEGRWLWPGIAHYDPNYNPTRIAATVVIAAGLLVWQFSKPLSIRSPALIPLAFAVVCFGWYLVGVIAHARASGDIFDQITR
jgi:hypothetical protein